MSADKIFVGRKAELEQFKEVLKNPKGEAVLVVGQAGMGKSWLVKEVVKQAEKGIIGKEVLKIKCWSVGYQITPTDDVNKTMEQIIMEATDAASPKKKKLGMTGQSKDKWSELFGAGEMIPVFGKSIKALGGLLLSWGEQKTGDTRTRFMKALEKLSDCMSDEKRAIFIIDPEKWMPKDSDHAWRLIVSELPDKIKLVFPQRPDDVLVTSDEFCLMKNVRRVPSNELDVLDDEAIDDLVDKYSKRTKYSTNELNDAVARYKGHPYAVGAALELIVDGLEIEKLPHDPRPVAIAEAQWKRICEKGDDAIELFEAYAILEVGVPDDVVGVVSELNATTRKRLQKDSYLKGLLREEGEGKRIYHAILMDYILGQIGEDEKKEYHSRAVGIYRKKLAKAKEEQIRPDALAAMRLAEHVLAAEGKVAFVDAFVNECFQPLLNLGLLDAAISLSARASEMVEKDSEEGATVIGNLGLIYEMRGELEKAEEMHKRALEIARQIGKVEEMARQYSNLGNVYEKKGELDKAEEMYKRALEINEKLGRIEGMAINYGNLGLIYRSHGELDKAKEMFRDGLKIDEKLGRLEGKAAKYSNLGLIYMDKGELNKAEEMYLKSLEIAEKLGFQEIMASDYGNLGRVYKERGDVGKAKEYWEKAVELYKRIGMPHEVKKVEGWINGLSK